MSFHVRRLREEKPRRHWPWKRMVITALTFSRPLHGWYTSWKQHREKQAKHRKRVVFLKRLLLVLVAVLLALLLFAGITKALVSIRILNIGTIAGVAGVDPPTDEYGFTNILLLGQGDADHDGKNLTDSIMVASIDPTDSHSVVLLSFPRDLYFLKTEKMGKGRLNSMYRDFRSYLRFQKGMDEKDASLEAIRELADEIGRILNLEMHHAVKVDFIGFVKAVDALGGVDIDVPYDIVDTEYPDENYGFETFEMRAGLQHLDGETSLKYARSRHTTSDFGRSARQQQLLGALGEQAKSSEIIKNPSALMDLIKILSDHVETTMSMREMIGFAGLADALDRSRIITMQLNDRNALYDGFIEPGGFLYTPPRNLFKGASVLLPISIPEFPVTWKQIHALSRLLFHMRSAYIANPKIAIFNAGAQSGSARKLGTELIRYGFDVETIDNSPTEDIATAIVAPGSELDKELAHFFASLLQLQSATLPTDFPVAEADQITIILGEDYTYTPIQNLLPTNE